MTESLVYVYVEFLDSPKKWFMISKCKEFNEACNNLQNYIYKHKNMDKKREISRSIIQELYPDGNPGNSINTTYECARKPKTIFEELKNFFS